MNKILMLRKCHICGKKYTNKDIRVRDNCHITGQYRGSAHEECNLKRRISSKNYLKADGYVDFYGNRHKIKRKSVYHRKYHTLNVINDIAKINHIQIGYYNRDNILRIFQLLDSVTPEVNNFGRKRLISVNFIIKQLFDILGVE